MYVTDQGTGGYDGGWGCVGDRHRDDDAAAAGGGGGGDGGPWRGPLAWK